MSEQKKAPGNSDARAQADNAPQDGTIAPDGDNPQTEGESSGHDGNTLQNAVNPEPDLEQDGWVDAGYDGELSAQPIDEIDPDEIIASVVAINALAQENNEEALREQVLRGSVYQNGEQEAEEVKFYIWEQWASEGDKAYAAFSAFRDTLPMERSVNGVYRRVYNKESGIASPHWRVWAKRFDWRGRVKAFDQWKYRRTVDAEIDEQTKARNEVKNMSRKLLQIAAKKMIALDHDDNMDSIQAKDIPSFLATGAKTNFMALGISEKKEINVGFSDRMETKVEVVFIDAPNEEQRRQEAMAIKDELTQQEASEEEI